MQIDGDLLNIQRDIDARGAPLFSRISARSQGKEKRKEKRKKQKKQALFVARASLELAGCTDSI